MNAYLTAAAALTVVIGAVHSIGGEVLIFRRLRAGRGMPGGTGALRTGHVRIVWASWHALTVLAWALAVLLVRWPAAPTARAGEMALVIAAAMAACGTVVGLATRGRHAGWIGLWVVAALVWLGGR